MLHLFVSSVDTCLDANVCACIFNRMHRALRDVSVSSSDDVLFPVDVVSVKAEDCCIVYVYSQAITTLSGYAIPSRIPVDCPASHLPLSLCSERQ